MRKRRMFFQLGRAGDILNILPLLKREFDETGERPLVYTRRRFERIFEGVSYAETIVTDGPFEDIIPALVKAEKLADELGVELVCTQIYGKDYVGSSRCSSFLNESWNRLPGSPPWGTLPLVFDRRDPSREVAIVEHLRREPEKKYVVAALSGNSSPFEQGPALRRALAGWAKQLCFEVIDVSGFVADRFFDLIGLLEGAACIISVDTGVLHLAAATKTPVVAIITREPSMWHGTSWRPEHAVRVFYDEIGDRIPIDSLALCPFVNWLKTRGEPRIFHVWSKFEGDAETERRKSLAARTWLEEGQRSAGVWGEISIEESDIRRTSADVGDPRPMPYVKDLVEEAINSLPDGSGAAIIALTNADVCFAPGLTGWILDRVPRVGACFSHRYDFPRLDEPLANEAAVRRGDYYPGSDAFFFTVEWWEANKHRYPDMILGRQQCDEVLRILIKSTGGLEIRHAIYHEKHASFWEAQENQQSNPGNAHNRALAKKFYLKTGYGPNDYIWWDLPKSS